MDIVTAAAIGVVAIVLTRLGVGGVTVPLGVALVFFSPGYAVMSLLMPSSGPSVLGRSRASGIDNLDRVIITIGLSLAIAALGGLLLNLTPWGLTATSWEVYLTAVTLAAGLPVLLQRRAIAVRPDASAFHWKVPLSPQEAILFGIAVILAIGAIGVARTGAQQQSFPGFTQLWFRNVGINEVRLAVRNRDHHVNEYSLRVALGGRQLTTWNLIVLKPGHMWMRDVRLPQHRTKPQRLRANLNLYGSAKSPYRYVSASIPPSIPIRHVFLIVMGDKAWSNVLHKPRAPHINHKLLPRSSYANQYYDPRGVHSSLSSSLWLVSGTNFGVNANTSATAHPINSRQHLDRLLNNSRSSWAAYEEGRPVGVCPVTNRGDYITEHDPFVYFSDVADSHRYCASHIQPLSALSTALKTNSVPSFSFIAPNTCDDMQTACPPLNHPVQQGDKWLSLEIPSIMASTAYKQDGAIFIVWDEGSYHGNSRSAGPLGLIVLSPLAKGHGYHNYVRYTESSLLRTIQELLNVKPLLGQAAHARDLRALFSRVP